jgi:peptide-methionine (S)-S-oxide reductase
MFFGLDKKRQLPDAKDALPGRQIAMPLENKHYVNGNPIKTPFPKETQQVIFALGCFWGAERLFWQQDGVYSTAVGYINGITPNPTYDEVCTGMTGHTEAVLLVFEPDKISFKELLSIFWESHDPTQGMRQGNDTGTQYRSGIYVSSEEQKLISESSRDEYESRLVQSGFPAITTEILVAPEFYYAEEYHQQYLAKNPAGYCGLAGTGVSCPA